MVIVTLTYFSNCLNSCNLVINFLVINLRSPWLLRQHTNKTINTMSIIRFNQQSIFSKIPFSKNLYHKKTNQWIYNANMIGVLSEKNLWTIVELIILNQCEQFSEYSIVKVLLMKHVLIWYDNGPKSIFAFILRMIIH